MYKCKSTLILAIAVLLTGCTREVYLQEVPCVEGECKCPCASETRECCVETQKITETIQYQIIDIPTPPSTYQAPCVEGPRRTRTCRKVCRTVRVR